METETLEIATRFFEPHRQTGKTLGITMMSSRFDFKHRLMLYLGIGVTIVLSSFFWGSPGQSWNMRQAHRQIVSVRESLRDDPRFADVKFLQSTADLGRKIIVLGTVPDQASFEYLKSLMNQQISQKFRVGYAVDVNEKAAVPALDTNDGT